MRKVIHKSLLIFLFTVLFIPLAHAGTTSFKYDAAGRLVSADYDGGRFIDFTYDPAGNLIKRIAGTQLSGDVVADGVIDLKDLIVTLQLVGAIAPEGAGYRSDVNGDHRVGVEEALYILEKVGGVR